MHTKGHPRNSLYGMSWNPANVMLVITLRDMDQFLN
jgi:hypothetical protein